MDKNIIKAQNLVQENARFFSNQILLTLLAYYDSKEFKDWKEKRQEKNPEESFLKAFAIVYERIIDFYNKTYRDVYATIQEYYKDNKAQFFELIESGLDKRQILPDVAEKINFSDPYYQKVVQLAKEENITISKRSGKYICKHPLWGEKKYSSKLSNKRLYNLLLKWINI